MIPDSECESSVSDMPSDDRRLHSGDGINGCTELAGRSLCSTSGVVPRAV